MSRNLEIDIKFHICIVSINYKQKPSFLLLERALAWKERVYVCICVSECVCVCVCKREREKGKRG